MESLTKKQQEFFGSLISNFNSRALSSYDKLKDILGYKSKNSIKQYIKILKDKNLIIKEDNKLYINPSYLGAKLAFSSVKAGFASVMDDKIEKRISFDRIFDINSPSVFVFKVSGDSMCNIGIFDGDYIIIKKTPHANPGDIVLAIVDNEFTLKTYKVDKKGAYLQPENDDYPVIRPKFSLSIFGVATGCVREI